MIAKVSVVDIKKQTGAKGLLVAILLMSLRDLQNGAKNPFKYQRYLSYYGDSLENVIYFWKNDAYFILSFLMGSYKAKKCLKKISYLIEEIENKLYKEQCV